MKLIEQAVLQTLVYSDLFDFPLKTQEILPRVPSILTQNQLVRALTSLQQDKLIGKTSNYWHIQGRKTLVPSRKTKEKTSLAKLARATKFSSSLAIFPSILAVFATGSLAVRNANPKDDIDLMIITKPNTLWTTRLFLTPILDALGIRRKPGDTSAPNMMCLNIYISEDSLTITPAMRSLYSAYELIQAVPLLDKKNIATRILLDNSWIQQYLPNVKLTGSSLPLKWGWNPFENIAYKLQASYMKSKKTKEHIAPDSAFFHPKNTSHSTLESLSIKMSKYNLETI